MSASRPTNLSPTLVAGFFWLNAVKDLCIFGDNILHIGDTICVMLKFGMFLETSNSSIGKNTKYHWVF